VHGILDLLEREEELLALDAAPARAREGHGLVVSVEGPVRSRKPLARALDRDTAEVV
jgi:hypothetical protein